MAKNWRLGTAGVLAAMLAGVLPLGASDLRVTVHLENYARVPASEWARVRREIEGIYRAAGITLGWAGPLLKPAAEVPPDGVRRVAMVLVNIQEPFAGSERDTADVLGRAVPDLSRAWVFANRVTEMTKVGAVAPTLLLARVVAHEIGHLLLESRAHAPHGIMRAGLELGEVGFYRFTDEQASLMRDRIGRHANVMTRGLLKQRDEGDDR
jgi:hypothetical protein